MSETIGISSSFPVAASSQRSMSGMEHAIESERSLRLESDTRGTPEDMPEIQRLAGMVQGSLQGVQRSAAALIAAVEPVAHGDLHERLRESSLKEEAGEMTSPLLNASTPHGKQLLDIYRQLGELERTLSVTRYALGV